MSPDERAASGTGPRALSRGAGDGPAVAPVALAHLGLGNFFRAHQAYYTARAPDAAEWGIAAFTGRHADLAQWLAAQDGLYTLITQAATGHRYEVIGSLSATHPGTDETRWRQVLSAPATRALTLTVTESAYRRAADGALDRSHPSLVADINLLRTDLGATATTVPGRLITGLAARRRADAGPIAVIPCDNLPDNGSVVSRVVLTMAELVDPGLREWIAESVSFVTTVVDRITPRPTDADGADVAAATGRIDRCPVVTEPFTEWVLAGDFPGGRPRWEAAGAQIVDDVGPFEQRKLWLLNGAHSLLAYAGSIRGHATVAQAIADQVCRHWVEQWWGEASAHLDQPPTALTAYRDALVQRFGNPALHHLLAQIAADGSQKIAVRVLPVLRAERAAGRVPVGATRTLAAWVLHLRGQGAAVTDADADRVIPLAAGPLPEAVVRVLDYLDPALAADQDVIEAVCDHAAELGRR